jgi:hypothetical protein
MRCLPASYLLVLVGRGLSASAGQTGTPRRILAADDSTHRLAIISPDGRVEREIKVGSIHDAQMLENGNILLQQGWTRIVEVAPDGSTVWEYDAAQRNGNNGKRVEVHSFQRLTDGSTMLAESGTARIIEVDRSGQLLREIKLKTDHPATHSDTRLVRKLPSGNYLAAQEADGCVREYTPTGDIAWEYPVPLFDGERKEGHGPDAYGNAVFSAIRLPNGNTLIGTGNGHRVLEVTPAKQIVWEVLQDDLPGIRLAWVTRVQRLANGNTLLGNCHAGPGQPQFIEVTPEKQVVWSFRDFELFGNSTPVQIALEEG